MPNYPPCPTPKKAGYDRKSVALMASDKLARRFKTWVYFCDCGRWHLTSKPPRDEKR